MEITYQHHSPHIDITVRLKKKKIFVERFIFLNDLYSQVYPLKISFQSTDSCLIFILPPILPLSFFTPIFSLFSMNLVLLTPMHLSPIQFILCMHKMWLLFLYLFFFLLSFLWIFNFFYCNSTLGWWVFVLLETLSWVYVFSFWFNFDLF